MDESKKDTPVPLKGISPESVIATAEAEAQKQDKEESFLKTVSAPTGGMKENPNEQKFRCTRIIQIPEDVFVEFATGIDADEQQETSFKQLSFFVVIQFIETLKDDCWAL